MFPYKEQNKTCNLEKGVIFDIQRYSIHDGPGIRTIVFLKGCQLHCPWCANPESQSKNIEPMGDKIVGSEVSVKDIIDIVERDKPFYDRSGGGMTLSGGEPLSQWAFSQALVNEAKKREINVAIETSGFQTWDLLWKVVENIDIILYDVKIIDPKKHKETIGVDNGIILDNAKKLMEMGKELIVRVPVIPGYTDSIENLNRTAEFCKDIGVKKLHFLPYHQLGVHKYQKLNREYKLHDIKPISKERLKTMAMRIGEQFHIDTVLY